MALAAYLQAETFRHLALGEAKGSRAYRKFLAGVPEGGEYVCYGPGFVANNYVVLRTNYPLAIRYVAAVIDVRSIGVEEGVHSAVYAYVYWPLAPGSEEPAGPEPEYVCVGPTFTSQDGEYRRRFLWWPEVKKLYEDETLAAVVSGVEMDILEFLSQDEIALDVRVYPDAAASRVVDWLDELRLPLRLFVLAQLIAGRAPVSAPHLLTGYKRAMAHVLEATAAHLPPPGSPAEKTLRALAVGGARGRHLRCGQKLVPLTQGAAVQVGNVIYPAWRELWAAQKASDLVLNGRTVALPLFNNWFAILGADAELFENEAMLRRHHTSQVVETALKQLEEARSLIRTEAGEAADPLDAEFLRGIRLGEGKYLLADYVLALTMQDLGETMATLRVAEKPLPAQPGTGDYDTVLFDYAYGCLNLHEVGVHGDLHLNNVTVYLRQERRAGLCTAFIAGPGGQADTYVLPNTGLVGCIIDFSRLIVNPKHAAAFREQLGDAQAAAFFRDQAVRILQLLHQVVPEFALEHQEAIKGMAFARPQAVFNVLTAVDYLLLGRNLGHALGDEPAGACWAPPSGTAREACRVLEEGAAAELLDGLRRLIAAGAESGASGADGLADVGSVGRRILQRAFGRYLYSNWDPGELAKYTLVDVQSAVAPLAYSGECLETLPPWVQPANLARNSGGLTVAQFLSRGDRPFLDAAEQRAGLPDPVFERAVEEERKKLATGAPGRSERRSVPRPYHSWIEGEG